MGSLIDNEGTRGMGRLGSHKVHGHEPVIACAGASKSCEEKRVCATDGCTTKLSRYNTGQLCGPCMYRL